MMNPRVKGSDTFSHISWTIHSKIKILDILKCQKIELNTSEKINLIEVPEVREKGVQTRRLYTPPHWYSVSVQNPGTQTIKK